MPTITPKDSSAFRAQRSSAAPFHVSLAGAPTQAIKIYAKHREEREEAGDTDESSHRHGLRMLQHAGWYKGPKGFQQIHSDLRDKVNVREAFQQPDGTFVIYDVDSFYPNAVKGEDEVYTDSDIRQIIANTNRGISAGGQKPGLLEGHPNPMQAAIGTQLDAHGFAVNWRESPRGRGWARCDLIGVDPAYVDRLRSRRLTGLSAAIARDAKKLNRRFGHVALLGGTTQALSHLPMHDIFSSSTYVCFSADATSFSPKGKNTMKMKFSDSQKKCFSDMTEAYSAYAAAEQSQVAGEPDADEKMKEAFSAVSAAKAAFDASMGPLPEQQPGDAQATMPGAGPSYAALPVGEVSEETHLPTEAELVPGKSDEAQQAEFSAIADQFSEDPAGAFSALTNMINSGRQSARAGQSKLATQVRKLTMANQALNGKLIRDDYNQFCAGLRNDGYQFDESFANDMFSMALDTKNPATALEKVKAALKKSPKADSLASIGSVFSAGDASPQTKGKGRSTQADDDEVLRELSEATGRQFSAEDMKIGSAFSSFMK